MYTIAITIYSQNTRPTHVGVSVRVIIKFLKGFFSFQLQLKCTLEISSFFCLVNDPWPISFREGLNNLDLSHQNPDRRI